MINEAGMDGHFSYSSQFACNVGLLAYFYCFKVRPFDTGKRRVNEKTVAYLDKCMILDIIETFCGSIGGRVAQ